MAYTQEDLKQLRQAMSSGILSTRYRDREVTYRSLDEMRKQEREMLKDLGLAAQESEGQGLKTKYYPTYGSGL